VCVCVCVCVWCGVVSVCVCVCVCGVVWCDVCVCVCVWMCVFECYIYRFLMETYSAVSTADVDQYASH